MGQQNECSSSSSLLSSSSTSSKGKSSFFNRSVTIHSSTHQPQKITSFASLDRSVSSVKKWYNPFESAGNSIKGKVKQLRYLFEPPPPPQPVTKSNSDHQSSSAKLKPSKSFGSDSILNASTIQLPGAEDRAVLFFTSLRGVRRTYEDCHAVRSILRAYRVYVDERDVSMDSAYRKELQSVMGEKNVSLPQVFIKGRYLGGAEIVKHLNEIGELRKILDGLPLKERGAYCDSCGDIRFVPCTLCDGSRKVYDEDEDTNKRCVLCNENGLVRCPVCSW